MNPKKGGREKKLREGLAEAKAKTHQLDLMVAVMRSELDRALRDVVDAEARCMALTRTVANVQQQNDGLRDEVAALKLAMSAVQRA